MAVWKNEADGSLHDDMNGDALLMPGWPTGMTQLTDEAAHAAQYPAPTTEQLAAAARLDRDKRIMGTDYLVMPDYPIDAAKLTTVKTYRQALRDISLQPGFPKQIDWPVRP